MLEVEIVVNGLKYKHRSYADCSVDSTTSQGKPDALVRRAMLLALACRRNILRTCWPFESNCGVRLATSLPPAAVSLKCRGKCARRQRRKHRLSATVGLLSHQARSSGESTRDNHAVSK